MIIDKYKEIVIDRYAEPKEEEIQALSCLYLQCLQLHKNSQLHTQKRLPAAKPNIKKKPEKQSRYIRQLFKRMAEKNANTQKMKSI